ncbi:MAG: hypothetical protein J0L92_33920 [Deltaproteobacteria bacterium]|nr:hypothetical protein [Deltaproteobacteria bacterium]
MAPLSREAEETLRRLHVFLFSIAQGRFWVPVALAGYTTDEHARGVFLARGLRGDNSFGIWRVSRSRRPPRDPDLPEQVAALARFLEKWRPRVLAALDVYPDPDDREQLRTLFEERPEEATRSTTWKTWSFTNLFEYLPKGEFYQPLWQEIVRQGVEAELAECKGVLDDVHAYLRDVPLEQEELDAIAESLEGYGRSAAKWLDERRKQLAALDPSDLEVLGLGETVPPPGFEPPLVLLSHIPSAGRA